MNKRQPVSSYIGPQFGMNLKRIRSGLAGGAYLVEASTLSIIVALTGPLPRLVSVPSDDQQGQCTMGSASASPRPHDVGDEVHRVSKMRHQYRRYPGHIPCTFITADIIPDE